MKTLESNAEAQAKKTQEYLERVAGASEPIYGWNDSQGKLLLLMLENQLCLLAQDEPEKVGGISAWLEEIRERFNKLDDAVADVDDRLARIDDAIRDKLEL